MTSRTPPASSVREGTLIKGFRVLRCIGTGSMGEVYEAQNEATGRRVAIKLLRDGAEEALNASRRLLEEARAVNAIRHPGIVEVFDVGLMGERRPFLVMELLEGMPLSARLKQGVIPVAEAMVLLEGILAALEAAHGAGVIHRDLKPSNVFLVEGSTRVKLLDFGVARRAGRTEQLTGPAMAVGSMGFMAPEQLLGNAVPSSDLYAVGCLAFLLLTGKPVFALKNIPDNARSHLRETPPRLRSLRPDAPVALEAFVDALLAKRPEARPASAALALARLRSLSDDGPITGTHDQDRRTELVAAFVPTAGRVSDPLAITQPSVRTTTVEAPQLEPGSTLVDS